MVLSRAMKPRAVILDFDGTFTDADEEAKPFTVAYKKMLADLLGRDLSADWDEQVRLILASPGQYGWEYDGKIVAPAVADPYLIANAVAQAMFTKAGILKEPAHRAIFMQAMYQAAYTKTLSVFREEAKVVLETILKTGVRTFVVTNAGTDAVRTKLKGLAPEGLDNVSVMGAAQKYSISTAEKTSAEWDALPESVNVEGLLRPILLRRGKYFDAITTVLQTAQCEAKDLLVIGDIFELDLALPLALGAHAHLVLSPSTPGYEKAEVLRRGETVGTLRDALQRFSA